MKYGLTRRAGRNRALYLALAWFLADEYDAAHAHEYDESAKCSVTFTTEEVSAHLAKRYVGCFTTARLAKKRAEDLSWLEQSRRLNADGKFR